MENEYTLSANDEWFLKQKRKDPFTQEYFKEGDTVVLCEKCRTVMLSDAWKFFGNRCLNCKNDKTIEFSKENCEYFKGNGGSNISIIGVGENNEEETNEEETIDYENLNKRVVYAVSIYNQIIDTLNISDKFFKRLYNIHKIIAFLLLFVAVGFTMLKHNTVVEKYNTSINDDSKKVAIENFDESKKNAKENTMKMKDKITLQGNTIYGKTGIVVDKNKEYVFLVWDKTKYLGKQAIEKPMELISSIRNL